MAPKVRMTFVLEPLITSIMRVTLCGIGHVKVLLSRQKV